MEELDRENEILMNSKECQTIPQTSDVSTQTVCIMLSYVDHDTQTINEVSDENDSQTSKTDYASQAYDLDTTFHVTEESSEDEEERFKDSADERPKGSAFIVHWSCLLILLQNFLTCAPPAHIKKIITKGSAICVHLLCQNGYVNVWRSQPMQNRYYNGNLGLVAAVLFSSNTFRKFSKYFKIMNIPWVSKPGYYKIQDNYMLGITNEAWKKEQEMNILQSNQRYLILSGDGRCDTPGYNAKYLNYFCITKIRERYLLHHLHK